MKMIARQTIRQRRLARHKARRARQDKTAQTKPSIARNVAGLAAKVFAVTFALVFGITLGFLAAIALMGI